MEPSPSEQGGSNTVFQMRIQEGGRFVGKGVYGCIFTPPLLCKGRVRRWKRKDRVGKLVRGDSEDAASEAEAGLYFKTMEGADKYVLTPDINTFCKPKPMNQQEESKDSFEKCNETGLISRDGYSSLIHYEMDWGGEPMYKYMNKVLNNPKTVPFLNIMQQLLEIGAYLNLSGVIHNDLHSSNLLVNDKGHIRAIDFGRSFFANGITYNKMEALLANYAPEFSQVPPESSTQDGIEEGIRFSRILDDLRTKKMVFLRAERILGMSRNAQIAEFRSFWQTSKSVEKRDWVKFWKLNWITIDSWSIGAILLEFLYYLYFRREFTERADWRAKQTLTRTVLRGMLRASPRERLDCVEALALYDPANDLVTSAKGQKWLEARNENRRLIKEKLQRR